MFYFFISQQGLQFLEIEVLFDGADFAGIVFDSRLEFKDKMKSYFIKWGEFLNESFMILVVYKYEVLKLDDFLVEVLGEYLSHTFAVKELFYQVYLTMRVVPFKTPDF